MFEKIQTPFRVFRYINGYCILFRYIYGNPLLRHSYITITPSRHLRLYCNFSMNETFLFSTDYGAIQSMKLPQDKAKEFST